MNRRFFIASIIGGFVSAVTGKINLTACAQAKIEPKEVESLEPRLMFVKAKELKRGESMRGDFVNPYIKELIEDIRRHGILNPLTVMADLTVINGLYRMQACQIIDMEMMVPVIRLNINAKEAMEYRMMANTLRAS